MNQYGQQARTYYQTYLPGRVAQLPDPEAFFEALGQEISEQVAQVWAEMAAQDQPRGETFTQKLGREQNARRRAEELVMQDLVYGLEPEPGTADREPAVNLPPGVHQV